MDYYQVEPQRTNARQAHENGDVESSHGHLKTAVDQALLLRGSRDFASREEYEQFLTQLIDKRNAARADKFRARATVPGRVAAGQARPSASAISGIKVHSSSTIQVKPQHVLGSQSTDRHEGRCVIDADEIEVWRAGSKIQTMPRLSGDGKHAINYRHVIDSLVRKPGALEHYQYHADMFPTSHFRMAYDRLLRDHSSRMSPPANT